MTYHPNLTRIRNNKTNSVFLHSLLIESPELVSGAFLVNRDWKKLAMTSFWVPLRTAALPLLIGWLLGILGTVVAVADCFAVDRVCIRLIVACSLITQE